jgi:hypothetical protein
VQRRGGVPVIIYVIAQLFHELWNLSSVRWYVVAAPNLHRGWPKVTRQSVDTKQGISVQPEDR